MGYHRGSWVGVSHLHTQLGALFLLPTDLGHSMQGLQGEVQVRSRFPKEECQRADSTKNLWMGFGGGMNLA